MTSKKILRRFQLQIMGFIAIFIGPFVLAAVSLIHRLPFPRSISETATISNRTGMILPFMLGCLALYSLSYTVAYTYDKWDRVFTTGMFCGFLTVAMQPSSSSYIDTVRVGLLGLSKSWSGILHNIGALIGFGSMILWVMFCFRKSDKSKRERSEEKNKRNTIYFWLGVAMILSLLLFLIDLTGIFGEEFPVVFVTEWVMLTFGGIACLLKGGLFLRDSNESRSLIRELKLVKE